MLNSTEKLPKLVRLLEQHAPDDGGHITAVPQVGLFRASAPQPRTPLLYDARIIILAQGEKICHIGNKRLHFTAGQCLVVTLPLPVEVEILGASREKPALMAGIMLDLSKIAALLLKLEDITAFSTKQEGVDPSSVFVQTVNDALMDAVIRLLETLDEPADRRILSESLIEEIYYRLLSHNQVGVLQMLLRQRRQIQQISRAIAQIHSHLDKAISVEELADLVGMGASSFHRAFKETMHMPPLQYAKSIKLTHAQALIREGKTVTQASQLVGYKSATQFSREYKRYFGYSPSQTRPA